ncbi:MAG: DUF2771 family protein [Pseudonocardia sp.]
MLRRLVPAAVAVLLVAGCGSDAPPEVRFAAGDASVGARPAQYCDLKLTDCRSDTTAPVTLAVPPDTPLRIEVPDAVAETPWVVVFSYRNASDEQVNQRSPLFTAGARTEYALELPTAQDRLLTAEVQQLGPPPQANAKTGAIEFPTRATWVLTASG